MASTQDASDETTPLLINSNASPEIQRHHDSNLTINGTTSYINDDKKSKVQNEEEVDSGDVEDEKPLPGWQIFFLCYARIIEPIAFFGIFPFINKMIWETGGLEESDVGFYSGLIVSSSTFSFMP